MVKKNIILFLSESICDWKSWFNWKQQKEMGDGHAAETRQRGSGRVEMKHVVVVLWNMQKFRKD